MSLKVSTYLRRNLRWGAMHFTLLDPEKVGSQKAAAVAQAAEAAGSHAILVGGSTGVGDIDEFVLAVKSAVDVPVILFPGGAQGVSRHADAILFMVMLNSRDPRFLVEEQLDAVDMIAASGVEPLPMGYVVVAPGGRVGQVGGAQLVAREDEATAVRYARLAQFLGMHYVYLEAGSGAPQPVPASMIKAVKREVRIPVIVGGGIRDATAAKAVVEAGADIFVTGNLLEEELDVQKTLRAILLDSVEGLKRRMKGD
jgi:phosphoglycerol geranylgeranyltransferase